MKTLTAKTELLEKIDSIKTSLYLNPSMIVTDTEVLGIEALIKRHIDNIDCSAVWKNMLNSIIASLDEIRNRKACCARSKTIMAVLDEFEHISSCAYFDVVNRSKFGGRRIDVIGDDTYNDDFMPKARRKMQRSIRLEEYASKQPKKDYSNWGVDNGKPVILDLNDAEEAKTSKDTINKVIECIKVNTLLMNNEQYCNPKGLAVLVHDTINLIRKTIKKYDREKANIIIDKYTVNNIRCGDIHYHVNDFIFDIASLINTFE